MTDQAVPAPGAPVSTEAQHNRLIQMFEHHNAAKRLNEMQGRKPPMTSDEHVGFNGKVALVITAVVGTMWAAYIFAVIGIVGIVGALSNSAFIVLLIGAISGYFLQLVLLPIIIVGQNIQGRAADKRAIETYKDAEAILGECLQLQHHLQEQDQILDDLVKRMQSFTTTS